VKRLGAAARLKAKASDEESVDDSSSDSWEESRQALGADRRLSILDAILSMRGAYGFIFEEDAVRVVPHSEALTFWAAWWAERSRK
jgi:hypothetical protein